MSERFYRKTNHACRACYGRVFAFVDENGDHWVECAECGLKRKGDHRAICACGYKVRQIGKDGTSTEKFKNAGFRCRRNPNVTPELPAEIIVVHEGEEANEQH